jgi:integrase
LEAIRVYDDILKNNPRVFKKTPRLGPETFYANRIYPSMILLYSNGIRIGDVIDMRWEEYNPNNNTLRFTPNKIEHKKPNKKVFPIQKNAIPVIRNWWEQNGKPSSGPMFPNPDTGNPYNKKSFRRDWPKIRELAELSEELDLQTLRHNFASQLIMKGASLFTVAELMATSVKMIEDYYGHLKPSVSNEALDLISF